MFENAEYFWLFLLVPVIFTLLIYDIYRYRKKAAKIAGKNILTIIPYYTEGQKWLKLVFYTLGFILVVFALARPKWGTETINTNLKGRNILVLIDVSYSMATSDIAPSRLEKTKKYVHELLETVTSDKIGVIIFSEQSELLVPLTHDYAAISFFLDSFYPGMLGQGGTNMTRALLHGIDSFDDADMANKMILLFTDGEDLLGNYKKVSQKIINSKIKIFTVGMGTRKGQPVPVRNEYGEVVTYIKKKSGDYVISKLDEQCLKEIAEQTGAAYLHSTGNQGEMKQFIHVFDTVKLDKHKNISFIERKDRFDIFLIPALIFFALGFILDQGRFFKNTDKPFRWIFYRKNIFLFVIALALVHSQLHSKIESHIVNIKPAKTRTPLRISNNGGYWGNKYFLNGNYKKALDHYISAAVNQDGNELSKLYFNIGNTFYRLNDYKNAHKYYELAAFHCESPDLLAKINYNQGIVYFKLKQFNHARFFFKKSILNNEEDNDARYNYFVSNLLVEKSQDRQQNQSRQKENPEQNQQGLKKDTEQLLKALDEKEKEENRQKAMDKQKNAVAGGYYW